LYTYSRICNLFTHLHTHMQPFPHHFAHFHSFPHNIAGVNWVKEYTATYL